MKEHLSKLARGDEQWRILKREILPEIGSVLLADLKPSQVMAAVVPMRKRAPRVAAMGISALRGVIRHARSMNRLDLDVADPTAGIPTIPQGKRSRALSDPEISLLLRWLDSGAVSRTIVDVLRLTLYTGARSGEVCAAPPAPAWRAWAARSRSANRSWATGCRVWPASATSMPTPTRCASGWIGGPSMWRELSRRAPNRRVRSDKKFTASPIYMKLVDGYCGGLTKPTPLPAAIALRREVPAGCEPGRRLRCRRSRCSSDAPPTLAYLQRDRFGQGPDDQSVGWPSRKTVHRGPMQRSGCRAQCSHRSNGGRL